MGDAVAVAVTDGVRTFRLTGIGRFGDLDTWGGVQAALFDTTTAQALVGEPDRYDYISAAGVDGVSQEELRDEVAAVLPPDTEAITGAEFTAESQDAFQKIIAVFNTFLLTFALIALFVGSFIIYNTFSIIVAQRTRELALLRAIGASRAQVLRSVLIEATAVGFVASAVGVGAGILLAIGLNALLRQVGFAGPNTPIVVPPSAVISSLAVGTVITVVSAVFPARRAATIAPVAAMRDVAVESPPTSKRRIAAGIVLVALGGGLIYDGLFGSVDSPLQLIGLGAGLVFLGMTVLGPITAPVLARFLGAPLPRLGVNGRLARENAIRNPRRTSTTASALMIGVGLVGFIAVAAASIKASTTDAIDASVEGQFVITTDGFGPTALPKTVAEDVRQVPGVATAAGLRGTFAAVDGSAKVIIAAVPEDLTAVISFTDVEGSLNDLDAGGIAVSKKLADDNQLTIGSPLEATFLGAGTIPLTVESVYDTRFPIQGPGYIVTQELFDANVPPAQQTDSAVYVKLDDGSSASVAAVRPALDEIVAGVPGAEVQDLAEYKKSQTDQANQFLVIVYVLLALALVIAIVGVVNTLLLSVYERTRELGLLRAVGMSRRQVRSSIRLESVIISLIGTVTGLVIGIAFGWALVTALYDDGITTFVIPWGQLGLVVVLAALAGVGAALYPARRAARLDILAAIATE